MSARHTEHEVYSAASPAAFFPAERIGESYSTSWRLRNINFVQAADDPEPGAPCSVLRRKNSLPVLIYDKVVIDAVAHKLTGGPEEIAIREAGSWVIEARTAPTRRSGR
jgi:hypothetical protein